MDYPLLDITLILTIISDYAAEGTLHSNEGLIREQLGALEAQVVADAADAAETEGQGTGSDPPPSHGGHTAPLDDSLSYSIEPLRSSSAFASASVSGSTAVTSVYDDVDDAEGQGPQSEADLLALFFPKLKAKDIATALAAEPSLEAAVDHLLSVELIRGVERSGTWGDEPEEVNEGGLVVARTSQRGSETSSATLPRRGSSGASSTLSIPGAATATSVSTTKVKKKKKAKGLTIPIVDTLQRRALVPASLGPVPRPAPSDVWSAFASLAAYLAEIAPRAAAPWFLTYLHAPDYYSAYDAVRAALSQLALTSPTDAPPEVVGILESVYGIPYDGEEDDSAQLRACVGAADANASDVMDLMDVLADLRSWPDFEAARMGERDPFDQLADLESALPPGKESYPLSAPSSAPPSRPTTPAQQVTRVVNVNRLTRPPPAKTKAVRAVPGAIASASSFAAAHELNQPANSNWAGTALQAKHSGNWRAAPSSSRTSSGAGKKRSATAVKPFIPGPGGIGIGYTNGKNSQNGNVHTNGNGTVNAAAKHFARADTAWSRRRDAMLAATAQFKSGPKHLQRQVAGYYHLRARELATDARAHSLDGARVLVNAQLERNAAQIDLHHRTVAEATTLAAEAVEMWWSRVKGGGGGPRFVVITGKGLHSAGQRGVLGPAVASSLRGAGWRVEEHEGYLTVKGR